MNVCFDNTFYFVYLCSIYFLNMKTISLKIDDAIFQDTENIIKTKKKARNRYINEAIDFYNKMQQREALKRQLQKESLLVREESMKVLKEFEALEDDLPI